MLRLARPRPERRVAVDSATRADDADPGEGGGAEPVGKADVQPLARVIERVARPPDRRVHLVDVPALRPWPVPGVEDPPVTIAASEDARLGRVVIVRPDGGR